MFNAKKDKLESVKRGHLTLEDAPDRQDLRDINRMETTLYIAK